MSKNKGEKGNLLLELFSEEIPARMQTGSEKQLKNLFETNPELKLLFTKPIKKFITNK